MGSKLPLLEEGDESAAVLEEETTNYEDNPLNDSDMNGGNNNDDSEYQSEEDLDDFLNKTETSDVKEENSTENSESGAEETAFDARDINRRLDQLMRNSLELHQILGQIVRYIPEQDKSLGEFDFPSSITYFSKSSKKIQLPEFLRPSQIRILSMMLRLRTLLFMNLLNTPEDQKRIKKYMKELTERDKKCQEKMDQLIAKLDAITIKNSEEVRRTSYRVGQLKNEMENLEKYLAERIRRTKATEEQTICQTKQEHEEENKSLNEKLSKMQKTINKLIDEDQSTENGMRRKIFKIESELDSVISKFDREMTTLQDEYDELDDEYTEEKKALTELEERFETLNEEYEKIMEERRLAEEKRKKEEEDRRTMEQAVTTIQAFWRSYKTRKMARGGNRSRGGKKK